QQLVAGQQEGVLATLSVRHAGWPFASLAPYALDVRGEPLLLLSNLAEHTRNLRADARASLLVQDGGGQAGARLTLLGEVAELTADEAVADARQRYVERHPDTAEYFSVLDFRLYVLHVRAARFIAGYGDMGWLDAAELIATA
ncbi:MAG: pyridoxamine 5'-phosphate oxidase family protein, partial [Chloroflexi bacterium]|nr:pyridoxamine 5'-phosphate oxidase family protein [Chloroflexota bacterium]